MYYRLNKDKTFEVSDKCVPESLIKTEIKNVLVSTVFLSIDHSFGSGEPILFETIIFNGWFDQEYLRCSTYTGAREQHRNMCNKVMGI